MKKRPYRGKEHVKPPQNQYGLRSGRGGITLPEREQNSTRGNSACTATLPAPQHYLSSRKGFLHVYQPLVGRASKKKIGITQGLHKWSVHEDIKVLQQGQHLWRGLGHQGLPGISGIAPDGLVRLGLYLACKFGTSRCLKQGIASGQGNMGKRIIDDNAQKVVNREFLSPILIPRLGIMAPRAMMAASRQVDARTETRTIHRGVFQDIKYTQVHFCKIKKADRRHSDDMLGLSACITYKVYYLCITRSFNSASLALFQRSVVPTR